MNEEQITRGAEHRSAPAIERLASFLRRLPYSNGFLGEEYLQELTEAIYQDLARAYELEAPMGKDELHGEVERLVHESRRQAPMTWTVVESMVNLVDVNRAKHPPQMEAKTFTPWTRHRGIRRAIACLNENYPKAITIDDLAKVACMGKSRFMEIFKKEICTTPHKYLRRVRIESATRLLREGSDVTQTCFAVGFTSLSGFEEAFLDLVGMRPLDYQKLHR